MKLRRADESDAITVLHWRNDPHTVAMCQSGKPVDAEDHYRWFQAKLADPDCFMFMAVNGASNVGFIRFDRFEGAFTVSLMIAPEHRGNGHGAAMLAQGIRRLGDYVGNQPLDAWIKADNAASLRLFERCLFRRVGEDGGFLHFALP